jgi:aspartyl-tRNA(Asn)/glutamyl-tRNA(Gln) amidotransferase subunit A
MDVQKVLEECKRIDQEYHYFNALNVDQVGTGKLSGLYISAKDAICVKNMESRAGSAILNGYKPRFDATVIERLRKEGASIIGKTSQDEFGFGSYNVNVGKGFRIPLNPVDKKRVTGGSSGGSAGLSKIASFRHVSLAESTGGSIACPAAYCGVYGLTPTYGRVSRYGLMDYGSSLDKIGPMGTDLSDIAKVLEVISGRDLKDSTSSNVKVSKYSKFLGKDVQGMKVGIIDYQAESVVKNAVNDKISELENHGCIPEKVKLPFTAKYGISTYYLLAMAEASTNLAMYSGMRYGAAENLKGNFNEYFSKIRTAQFSDEAKRRIIIGTFVRMAGYRNAYYIKAAKVRTKIINEYKKQFKKFDCLISACMPSVAPRFNEVEKLTPLQHYMADQLTVGPNLAGLPHLSVPLKGKLPIGMMIIGNHFDEGKIIQMGSV